MTEPIRMNSTTPRTKPRPVLLVMATLAGLDVLTGGAALGDVIGLKAAGLLILLLAAIKAGMAFFLQGQVVPVADTAAYLNDERQLVAGPAAIQRDGAEVVVESKPARF